MDFVGRENGRFMTSRHTIGALFYGAGAVAFMWGIGCGGPLPLNVGYFVSDVVNKENCEAVADSDPLCTRGSELWRVQVVLQGDDDGRVSLLGAGRAENADQHFLGTLDDSGGLVFYNEQVQKQQTTGCVITSTHLLRLTGKDGAKVFSGSTEDPSGCTPLIGREFVTTISSAKCNEPPQKHTVERRYEWQAVENCN